LEPCDQICLGQTSYVPEPESWSYTMGRLFPALPTELGLLCSRPYASVFSATDHRTRAPELETQAAPEGSGAVVVIQHAAQRGRSGELADFPQTFPGRPVPELCQNPIRLRCKGLLFEREQLPQVVDNRHFRIELMECLEPEIILRNQQVAGSIPAGGSRFYKTYLFSPVPHLFRT